MSHRLIKRELCVYFIVCSVFLSFFLTHKYKKKRKCDEKKVYNTQTHNSLNTQFIETGVGGWQGYVRDLVAIRDRLQRNGALRLEDTHPVYDAIDSVGPVMSPAIETFVRRVILEYAS